MQQSLSVCVGVCVCFAGTCAPVVHITCDIVSLPHTTAWAALMIAVWSSAYIVGFDVCATACLT